MSSEDKGNSFDVQPTGSDPCKDAEQNVPENSLEVQNLVDLPSTAKLADKASPQQPSVFEETLVPASDHQDDLSPNTSISLTTSEETGGMVAAEENEERSLPDNGPKDNGSTSIQTDVEDLELNHDWFNDKEASLQHPQADGFKSQVRFYLFVHKNASKVTLQFETDPSTGDSENCAKHRMKCMSSEQYGKNWMVSVPLHQNLKELKYKYVVNYHNPVKPGKKEEKCVRVVMCGRRNHYDVFKEKKIPAKPDRTFKGKFVYIKMLYDQCKDGADLHQIWEDIEYIGLDSLGNISDVNRNTFLKWVDGELNKELTPYTSAVMCSIMGQVPTNVSSGWQINTIVADTLLNYLCQCSRASFSRTAIEAIRGIHVSILKKSSWKLTNLAYVNLFGTLFRAENVVQSSDLFETPEASMFDDIVTSVIQRLTTLQDSRQKEMLVKFVISKTPTVSSMLKLSRQLKMNESYEQAITNRFPSLLEKEQDKDRAFWNEIPDDLKPKLALIFFLTLRKRLEQKKQLFDDKFISELFLHEGLQKRFSKDLVEYLKFLSSCKHNTEFLKRMHPKDSSAIVKNLAKSTIAAVLDQAKKSEKCVAAMFVAFHDLCNIPALEGFDRTMESSVLEMFTVFSLETIVNAYNECQECATGEYVQRLFATVATIRAEHEDDPEPNVKSKLLNCILALSSKDEEINRRKGKLLFHILEKSKVPHPKSISAPTQEESRSVVEAVLSEKKMWTIIFEESLEHGCLSNHRKYIDVKSVMDKLTTSFIDGQVSLNSIMNEDDKNKFADFLVLKRCVPPGIEVSEENIRSEWMHILSKLFAEKELIERNFDLLDKSIRLVKEIATREALVLLDEDMNVLLQEYNNRKRKLADTKFADIRDDYYWGHLKTLLIPAEGIYQLCSSIFFKNFAKHRLEERIQAIHSVEDIIVLLNNEVQAFKDILRHISDQTSQVTSKEMDRLLTDDVTIDNVEEQLKRDFAILKLPGLSEKALKIVKDYLMFDLVKEKIQVALDCLKAVGYALQPVADEGNFLQTLHSFMNCKESGTLNSVSAYLNKPTIVKVNEQLSPDLVDTLRELSRAKELIEFITTTAKDNMVDLVEAVEEYSDQRAIQASTVSYLIYVHRFFSEHLSNKPREPEMFLDKVSRAYASLTGDIPLERVRVKVNMAAKINVVSCNVHSLKGLHMRLSNREELTKEIIQHAVHNGRYRVWIDVDGSVGVELTYEREDLNKTEAKHNIDDLNDLRSRALLLVNAETMHKGGEDKEKGSLDYQKDLRLFIDQVILLTEIVLKYKELKTSGIPEYDTYFWKFLETIDEIKQEEARVNSQAEEWHKMMQSIRKQYFFLNYFHTNQLWILKSFFNNQISSSTREVSDEVLALFHCIDAEKTRDFVLDCHSKYGKPTAETKSDLCEIGKTLEEIFGTSHKKISPPTNKGAGAVEPSKLYVGVLEEDSVQTVHVIMSLFKRTCDDLPKPSQLLFCSPHTTWDEIELLLLRTFEAHRHGFTSKLHCIANVECLPNDIQFKLVEKLEALINTDAPYLLAIVCRGKHQHVADHFSDYSHRHGGMPDADMRDEFRKSCPNTFLVTGDLPGLGKSEEIYAHAGEKGKAVVTFPISGPFERGKLVKRLSKLKLKSFQSIHFDVGEVDDPVGLDTFLFELIVTKMVSSGALIFSLATNHVYIEVANTLNQGMRNSLPVCKFFERLEVKWEDYSALIVSNELTSCIQVVCHYLNAFDSGNLEGKEVALKGPKKLEPLSSEKCQRLLEKYFPSSGDLNFNIVQSFLSILAGQLLMFSRNPYLKPELLKSMPLRKLQHIRYDVFKALLEVSTSFVNRSVSTCKLFQRDEKIKAAGGTTTEEIMVNRVKGMIQWADIEHLVIMLSPDSITPLYRSLSKVPQNVKHLFTCQDVFRKGLKDYTIMSQDDLQETLVTFSGAPLNLDRGKLASLNYALTPDNLLKMALIMQRMQAGIPVIIMGETGCGKTSLVRYLAQTCDIPFDVFSLHAGITEQQIIDFILSKDNEARSLQEKRKSMWVFLDEVNTCEYLGTINEIVCHHSIHGRPLASNLMFVAACNPYRLRRKEEILTAGLTGRKTSDEMSKLVYRVHPLPETMIDYVWDYGSLTSEDEKAYIGRMVEKVFDGAERDLLTDLLAKSQEFFRKSQDDPTEQRSTTDRSSSCVSLRDVRRATTLMPWFYKVLRNRPQTLTSERPTHLQELFNTSMVISNTVKAVVLSLAHCYFSRLPTSDLRRLYCSEMTKVLIKHKKDEFKSNPEAFEHIIRAEQEDYLSRMELPKGTAKNAALRENVFVILVCILNRIPVFLVGKPGCSKSLSMQIIRSNLRGRDSKDPFLKTLPELVVVSFQGSESSTSEGIEKVFKKAREFKSEAENNLPVVLLDEIGLAEVSKFNPLKVLHHLLETKEGEFPDVAVVGISNWALDAAKMNRAIHLSRPDPDEKDLYETGLSIIAVKSIQVESVEPYIKCLAEAYSEYQSNQNHDNFHGLRDYYSMVKCLDNSCRLSDANSQTVQRAMQRNFGGTIVGKVELQSAFLNKLEASLPIGDKVEFHVTGLIRDNLNDRLARHLMLITSGDSGIDILGQTLKGLNKEKVTIIGSNFEDDDSADYSHRILSRIILCMERNCILILRNLERIYGSLYDMLNQNYMVVGGKKNCRIALGAFSNPMCQVDDGFRCIVLVDEDKIDYSDPPFLNRFEKQLLRFSDVLSDKQRDIVNSIEKWVKSISTVQASATKFDEIDMFAGFHEDTLASLVLLHSQDVTGSNDTVFKRCKDDLMSIAMPDAVIRICKSKLHSENKEEAQKIYDDYFEKPVHDGLKAFLEYSVRRTSGDDPTGMKLVVMTHSNIHNDVSISGFVVQIKKLSSFKTEKNFSRRVKDFFLESKANLLIVQCRPETDAPLMLHMKAIIEEQKEAFIKTGQSDERQKHVCIVIHLRRSLEAGDVHHHKHFNFSCGWSQVMIECLEKATIEVKELLKCSIADLIKSEIIPFRKVAVDQLHWCFEQIKFPISKRPSQDEISSLVKALTSNNEIMDCFMKLCCRWIHSEQEQVESTFEWKVDVACDRQALINSSTFVKAMEYFIIHFARRPLARIVYFLQKHTALQALIGNDVPTRQECCNLLSTESVFKFCDVPEPQGPESLAVYFSCADLQFPFSYLFCKRIDSLYDFFSVIYREFCMKEENLDENEELTYDSRKNLVNEVKSKVELVVAEIKDSKILSEKIPLYVNDFLDIKTSLVSDVLNRRQRIEVMKAIYGDTLPSRSNSNFDDVVGVIAQLHCSFWLEGNAMPPCFYLIRDCMSTGFLCIDDLLEKYWNWNAAPDEDNHPRLISGSIVSEKRDDILAEENDEPTMKQAEENDESPIQPEDIDDGLTFPIQEAQDGYSKGTVLLQNMAEEQACESKFGCEGASVENTQCDGEEGLATDARPTFDEFLVQQVCCLFLPTEAFIDANGGIEEWKSAVNLVLTSTAEHCYPIQAYYFLKLCSDFACRFNEPRSLYDLAKLGRKVTDEVFLASSKMFEAICNLLEDLRVKGHDKTKLDEFTFLFYERCIQSDPESEVNRAILKKVSFDEKDHMLPLASSLLNTLILTAHDQLAFSLETLEQFITSSKLDNFPNLMELNSFLSRLQVNEKELDSHINVICCDLINRHAFKDLKVETLSGSDHPALKLYHKAVDVLAKSDQNCKNDTFGFICAVSYLRALMSDVARLLCERKRIVSLDWLLRDITTCLQEGEPQTRKSAVSKFLLKELVQIMCLYDVKELIQNCKPLHQSAVWRETDPSYKMSYNPFKHRADSSKLASGLDVYVECKKPSEFENAVASLKDSHEERLHLAAIAIERFYIVRSNRKLNDTDEDVATFVYMSSLPQVAFTYSTFLARVTSQKSFKFKQLEISPQTKAIDVQVAVLIQHLSAILTSSVTTAKSKNPIMCCLNDLVQLKGSYMVASPDKKAGYPLYKHYIPATPPVRLSFCKCGTRFAAGQVSPDIRCPRCKSPCKEDESVKQTKPQAIKGYINSLKCDMAHIRHLDPVEFRLVHLIVHAALLAGFSMEVVSDDELGSFMKDDNPSETCYKIIKRNLKALSRLLCSKKENIITLVHEVIKEVSVLLTEDGNYPLPHNEHMRSSWEDNFAEKVQPIIQRFRKGLLIGAAEDHNNASMAALVYESHFPEFEDVTSRNLSVPRLFRVTSPNTFNKLREVYLNSPTEVKKKHQLLGLFLDYHDRLELIGNLAALLSWSRYVDILLSRGLTRSDAKERRIIEEVHKKEQEISQVGFQSAKGDSTKQKCEEFVKAWKNVILLINESIHDGSDGMPYIGQTSVIGYCLAEKQDLGRFLCQCFVSLAEMQNEFLDKCLAIASNGNCSALQFLSKSGFPVIHVQDAKKKEIICYEWIDSFLEFSYCETEYGRGTIIHYEMEKIEKQLAGYFLLGKAYLDTTSGIREFVFSKQLFHDCANILNELCESIPQDKLPSSVEDELANQSMYMSRLQTLLGDLELVLCYLRRIEAKPNESLAEHIGILMSSSRPFSNLLTSLKDVQIKHVCALYEFVEDQLAAPSVECNCEEVYRAKIRKESIPELRKPLQDADNGVLEAVITAIKRFAFRYLHMKPNPGNCLLEVMKDPSLWPMALRLQPDFKVSEAATKFFPIELTIGQTYEVHGFFHNIIEERNKTASKSRCSGAQSRTAVQKKRKGRKTFN